MPDLVKTTFPLLFRNSSFDFSGGGKALRHGHRERPLLGVPLGFLKG